MLLLALAVAASFHQAQNSGSWSALLVNAEAGGRDAAFKRMEAALSTAPGSSILVGSDAGASQKNIARAFQDFPKGIRPGSSVFIHLAGHATRIPDLKSGSPDGYRQALSLGDVQSDRITLEEIQRLYDRVTAKRPAQIVFSLDCDQAERFALSPSEIPTFQLFSSGAADDQDDGGPELFPQIFPNFTGALSEAIAETQGETCGELLQRIQSVRLMGQLLDRSVPTSIGPAGCPVPAGKFPNLRNSATISFPPLSFRTDRVRDTSLGLAVSQQLVGTEAFVESVGGTELELDFPRDSDGQILRKSRLNLKLVGSSSTLAAFENGSSFAGLENFLKLRTLAAVDHYRPEDGHVVDIRVGPNPDSPVASVRHGSPLSIWVRSRGNWRPYVCLYSVDAKGRIALVSPAGGASSVQVSPEWTEVRSALTFPEGWLVLKAIATSSPISARAATDGLRDPTLSNPYFSFERASDGACKIVPSGNGWCTSQASVMVIEDPSEAEPFTYFLDIGIDKYREDLIQGSSFAGNDARGFAAAVNAMNPVDRTRAVVLVDSDATRSNIESKLREAAKTLRPQDTFVFTFSGNSTVQSGPGKRAFLWPHDTRIVKNKVYSTISLSELKAALDAIPCRNQIVVLDSFRSVGEDTLKTFIPEGGSLMDEVGADGNRLYLVDESSAEDIQTKHSMLSYAVITAIRDSQTDGNRDGIVSSVEIARRADQLIRAKNRRIRDPHHVIIRQTGEAFAFLGTPQELVAQSSDLPRGSGPFVIPDIQQGSRGAEQVSDSNAEATGRDYALLIGTDRYQPGFQPLKTPILEINNLASALETCNYEVVKKLENPRAEEFFSVLKMLQSKQLGIESDEDNQLLIYIAGHGLYGTDRDNILEEQGYFVASDTVLGDVDFRSYVDAQRFIKAVSKLDFKNICIVVDVCDGGNFAAKLVPASIPDAPFRPSQPKPRELIRERFEGKSIYVVASGVAAVPDGQEGVGTEFSRAWLDWLTQRVPSRQEPATIHDVMNYLRDLLPQPVYQKIEGRDTAVYQFIPPMLMPRGTRSQGNHND